MNTETKLREIIRNAHGIAAYSEREDLDAFAALDAVRSILAEGLDDGDHPDVAVLLKTEPSPFSIAVGELPVGEVIHMHNIVVHAAEEQALLILRRGGYKIDARIEGIGKLSVSGQ